MLDIFNINTELFHFLRPQLLWLFVPMLIVLVVALLGRQSRQKWESVIAKPLQPYLIQKGSKKAFILPLAVSAVIFTLIILAAAGPSWEKQEVPGAKSEAILLIALDLSPSMLVEDISPNRLERAKMKIEDLLEANPGAKVGLLAYAGTAHPVITPSTDYKLVKYQLKSLQPNVMPVGGTNIHHALAISDTILSRTEAPSTLLLISDNIESADAEKIKSFASGKNKVEIMTLASPQGARIPGPRKGTYIRRNGNFVISKLNQAVVFDLHKHPNINVNPVTLDKQDVEVIAQHVKDNLVFQKIDEQSEEDWKEMGFALLWPVLVLFALWFRKGWMIQWCLVLFMFTSCNTEVSSWNDLWLTKDYQGQKAYEKEDYTRASDYYESLQHKGVAFYKEGNYEAAIEMFKLDSSASSVYNLGLAYAANGQPALAQEALLLASNLAPENEAIKESIERNSLELRKLDSLRSVNPENAIELKDKKETKGELNERKAASEDEELTSDTEVDELPKDGDRITDEIESGMRKAEEMERPPEDFQPQKGESAQNVLLREISAEPSEFLRRRFKHQYEKYYNNVKTPEEPW